MNQRRKRRDGQTANKGGFVGATPHYFYLFFIFLFFLFKGLRKKEAPFQKTLPLFRLFGPGQPRGKRKLMRKGIVLSQRLAHQQ